MTSNVTPAFNAPGDVVVLMGREEVRGEASSLAGSEYLDAVHGLVAGRPTIDLDREAAVQRACRRAIKEGLLRSAHDCSDGGLAVALAECCIAGGVGFRGDFSTSGRWDAAFFGEGQSRIVVSLSPDRLAGLDGLCQEEGLPWTVLGHIGGDSLAMGHDVQVNVEEMALAWRGGLERALGGGPRS